MWRARGIEKEIQALRDARQRTFDQLLRITQNYQSDGAQNTKDPHKYDKLSELNDLIPGFYGDGTMFDLRRPRIRLGDVRIERIIIPVRTGKVEAGKCHRFVRTHVFIFKRCRTL